MNNLFNIRNAKYNDEFIHGINPDTNVNSLIENIKKISSNAVVSIKNKDNENKVDSVFATGDTVSVTIGEETKTFNVVIYGDINGDGKVSVIDVLYLLKNIVGSKELDATQIARADVSGDSKLTVIDVLMLQKIVIS